MEGLEYSSADKVSFSFSRTKRKLVDTYHTRYSSGKYLKLFAVGNLPSVPQHPVGVCFCLTQVIKDEELVKKDAEIAFTGTQALKVLRELAVVAWTYDKIRQIVQYFEKPVQEAVERALSEHYSSGRRVRDKTYLSI